MPDGLPADRQTELEDKFRKTLAQLAGGVILIIGAYVTWRRVLVTQEGQLTDRFSNAVEHLGSARKAVTIGGVYALERIARDSRRDHWQVMEMLTTYVRSKAQWKEPATKPRPVSSPIQAILNVVGRRERSHERSDQELELRETDLHGAHLVGAHLEGAILIEAHLEGAFLTGAHLNKACLHRAHLERAHLNRADLRKADLVETQLEATNLRDTNLKGAYLKGANLTEADLGAVNLTGADLTGACSLVLKQINSATIYRNAVLPDYLRDND